MSDVFWMIRTASVDAPRVPFPLSLDRDWREDVAAALGALNASPGLLAGMVTKYGGATAPAGWLICDGQALETRDYPALFSVLAYRFGGSGALFNIPTQAQCDGEVLTPPPAQVITGGSVEPTVPPVVDPANPGATGANSDTGGRVRFTGSEFVEP